jgi:Ala-tRNA(Pro) deacylase
MRELLQKERIPYRLIFHPEAYTAPEVAASIHIPGREVAKVVVVRADGKYVMAVLPANRLLDLKRFARGIGAEHLSLAQEWELEKLFPDCEVGAMPPLGNLYELPVYVDASLAKERFIFFPAGSHHETVEIWYEDFERLVHPMVGQFALEPQESGRTIMKTRCS